MTTLPRPTQETYIDFLKRKLKGRNISPEFMARNPAYFDLQGEDAPTTPATWETFYRKAKPKTSVDSGRDEGMFSPDPPNNIPYTKDGIFHAPDGSIHVDMAKAYRDYYLAQADRTITNAPREFERAVNEFNTGFPDFRSNESIAKEQAFEWDEDEYAKGGLIPAAWERGYENTGMSLDEELMPIPGLYRADTNEPVYHPDQLAMVSPEQHGYGRILGNFSELGEFNPNFDVRGEAGIPALSNQAFGVSKWSPHESLASAETRRADEEKYGEPGLFPNFMGPLGEYISNEIWGPVEQTFEDIDKKGLVEWGKDYISNIKGKDVVSGLAGGAAKNAATYAGAGLLPATFLGLGVGTIADMMMSPGHGQIGMPGQVEHSVHNPNGTWSTTYSPDVISHFNSEGIAVNTRGETVLTPGPMHDPTAGLKQYGSPTESDDGGHQAGDVGSPSDEEPGEFGPDW